MSGKGSGNSTSNNTSNSSSGGGSSSAASGGGQANEPTIISGWEHSTYAHRSDRYAYIGKDEDTGEPEWIDYGPKGGR